MKVTRLEKVYVAVLMVIFGGIVLQGPISVDASVLLPDYSLLIKSWKEIAMLGLVPVAALIITKRRLWKELTDDWVFRLIITYAVLHIFIVAAFYQGVAATMAGLAIDLRYVLFFGLVYAVLRAMPQYRYRMLQIGVVGAVVVTGFATLQLFLPADTLTHIGYSKDTIAPYLTVDKNPQFIRVNSTLRGPNPLGAYAVIVLGLLAAALARASLQLRERKGATLAGILALFSSVALWISYSRSALLGGIITIMVVLFVVAARTASRRVWIISAVVLFALTGTLALGRGSAFVSNVLLHENPSGGSSLSSNEGHVQSLSDGLNDLVHQPLGAGVGSAGSASLQGNHPVVVENQYLFIAHETGWLGFVLFMTLLTLVMVRLWRGRAHWLNLGVFASGIGLVFIGLVLPVWADDTVSIVWWGLAAIALTGGNYAHKQTK